MPRTLLKFEDIAKRIVDALKDADGDYITEVHNKICDPEVKYLGDSSWVLKEEQEEKEEVK